MVGKKKWYIKLLIMILLGAGALFSGFPILWMLLSSLKPNGEIFAWPPIWISENFSLKAYSSIFHNPEKVRFFINSYCIAMLVVILTLIIGILASYSFSRFNFPGKSVINTLIVSVQAVPPSPF